MNTNNNSANQRHLKQNNKEASIELLKKTIANSEYIDVIRQREICAELGLQYLVGLFRIEYRQRFYDYLKKHTTTVATVSKETKIPHKYLCEVKAYYQNRDLLKIVMYGKCPTTGSNNVQFLSTNPEVWENSSLLPKSNQLKLF